MSEIDSRSEHLRGGGRLPIYIIRLSVDTILAFDDGNGTERIVRLFVAAHAVVAVAFRDTDFFWHIQLGNAFLAGEPFTYGGDWYPLSRTMFDALPALLPYRLSRALFFLAGVASLGLSVVLWNRMADAGRNLDPGTAFAATVFSLLFMAPYISRDFQECGLQLLLLGMLSIAGYSLWRGRDTAAGAALGAAIAYKFTPIICLPLLVWKGRWKAALWTAAAVVILNVLPAVYLGVVGTVDAHRRWVDAQKSRAWRTLPRTASKRRR